MGCSGVPPLRIVSGDGEVPERQTTSPGLTGGRESAAAVTVQCTGFSGRTPCPGGPSRRGSRIAASPPSSTRQTSGTQSLRRAGNLRRDPGGLRPVGGFSSVDAPGEVARLLRSLLSIPVAALGAGGGDSTTRLFARKGARACRNFSWFSGDRSISYLWPS